ncbi:hypothetical protein BN2475_1010002 [Paraburkholderia ribeironis]|uniref:Rhamnogalacturonase A/B/Epimerase-like pectate lyase domain-containing protein n=1 Tax=Paraburkholderia ribeironis TaxID=1247936 RepID=A0A1N7SLU1_9BURK|nr:glycosyl hydrolase family 28-related protein [Paraburkholderia ribeironis]SIT48397.1 hypothetical protein BN2475_1010002 [Paraburkholderia ribeironis]
MNSLSGEAVNVKDFGAKGDGIHDDQTAFQAAIDSFSPINESLAGTVLVPVGTYRLASPVRIKKSVWMRGSQGASLNLSTHIRPDAGVTAFVLERFNTPTGTTSAGAGDGAQISNLVVQPAAKVSQWAQNTTYQVGDKRRTGSGSGRDWRRHYICTQTGISAASGIGPRSLGNDETLNYDNRIGDFTVDQTVTGASSAATGIIIANSGSGSAGQLRLTSVSGTFLDNETISDAVGATATANGGSTVALTDEQDGTVRWRYIGSGAGIKIRANGVTLRDVTVLYCSGNGVHIEAPDPLEAPRSESVNANSWHLDNINIWGCDGHGLYVRGSDTNGGSFIHGVMYSNGGALSDEDYSGAGFNIYESSFLGNTYVSIQMGLGGMGSIYSESIGGGSTWIGCYQEGTGGGENVFTNSNVIVGGGISGSIMSANSVPAVLAPVTNSRGHNLFVAGYSGPPWRRNVAVRLGDKRMNNGNLYQVTVAGTTNGIGPSGMGSDIVDGTAHWSFLHAGTDNGAVGFGSVDPNFPYFAFMQSPDDVGRLPTFWQYGSFGGVNHAHLFTYGASGTGTAETGPGLIHAVNKTEIAEWPAHVPAGRALFDMVFVGGCKVTYGTGVPDSGIWNKGDRVFFKGAAVVPGGAEGLVCTVEGTAGSYSGERTATTSDTSTVAISGGVMSNLKDQQDFKVGDKLVINGVTSRVLAVSDDGKTLAMDANIPGGSGLAIIFANPVFKTFGSIAP